MAELNVTECLGCPPGGYCVGPITSNDIRTLFGWYRCPNLNIKFERCLYSGACLGAPNERLKGQFKLNNELYDPALNDTNATCATGYSNTGKNLRCSICAPNFSPAEAGKCEECTGGSEGSIALVVLAVFLAIILFTILVALRMRSSGSKKAEHSTLKRTLLTHLQMLSIVMSLTVPWPTAVRNILTFVSSITSISAQASSIQCTTTDGELTHALIFYITLTCSVLLPFFMMLVTFVYWFVCVPKCKVLSCGKKLRRSPLCPTRNPFRVQQQQQPAPSDATASEVTPTRPTSIRQRISMVGSATVKIFKRISMGIGNRKKKKKKKKKQKATRSTRDGWIVTNVLVVYTISPSIVKSCFQMLQPEEVCQINYWSLDDTITFDNANHQNMIFFVAVPSLLFYGVVCPLLVMFYIGRHTDRQKNRKLMFRFGLLYSGFAPEYWFYELILYLRKLLIILIVTFASSSKQQLHIALGVLIALLYLLEHLRPYSAVGAISDKDRVVQGRLHRMESLSIVILISMVWSAVFFVIGCNDNDGFCSVLGVVVLGLNVIFALGAGYVFVKSFQKKNQLGEKLMKLSSALSSMLSGRSASERSAGEERGGENEEFHFETMGGGEDGKDGEDGDEIGHAIKIKINPLASGASRGEFAKRRKFASVQRQQMVSSGFGSGDGSSSGGGGSSSSSNSNSNNINAARTAPAEIEMMSVEKKKTEEVDEAEVAEAQEEEEIEIFVAKNGNSYFVNSQTGKTEWVK